MSVLNVWTIFGHCFIRCISRIAQITQSSKYSKWLNKTAAVQNVIKENLKSGSFLCLLFLKPICSIYLCLPVDPSVPASLLLCLLS